MVRSAREWWYGIRSWGRPPRWCLQRWFDQIQAVGWEDMGLGFPPQHNCAFCGCGGCASGDVVICWRDSGSRWESVMRTKKGMNDWKCEYEYLKHAESSAAKF